MSNLLSLPIDRNINTYYYVHTLINRGETQMKPTYYAIIPAAVRYDSSLKPAAKLMFGEITALSQVEGYCYAANAYFAELYNVSKETVSRWINSLKKAGYISVEMTYKPGTKEVDKRIIKVVTEISIPSPQNNQTPHDKKIKDNITSNNNTRNNKLATLNEIEEACKKGNLLVDANKFYNYYESKGGIKLSGLEKALGFWEERERQASRKRLEQSTQIEARTQRSHETARKVVAKAESKDVFSKYTEERRAKLLEVRKALHQS